MGSKRRLVLNWLIAVIVITSMLFMFGCKAETTTTPTTSTTTTTTTAEPKTLNIGVVAWLGFTVGLGMVNSLEVMADMDNANGGLEIGGEMYEINFIVYDTNNDQSTAQAAINKLVYEDEVKFIIADPFIVDPWLSITEENGVVVCAQSLTPGVFSPDNHYTFQCGFTQCGSAEFFGWFTDNYPEMKTLVCAWADDQSGHAWADSMRAVPEACGLEVTDIFYPPEITDLSAVGTQVRTMDPDAFMSTAHIALKAARDSGWDGQLIMPATATLEDLASVVPLESLEGMILQAWPTEFDPALTEIAQEFKDAYIAKYGEWDGPQIQGVGNWSCLRAAFLAADSIDPDEVAAVIANGLEFEGPNGAARMVSRPDLGNERTIDCIVGYVMKQIVNGDRVILDTITIEDALEYFQRIFHE